MQGIGGAAAVDTGQGQSETERKEPLALTRLHGHCPAPRGGGEDRRERGCGEGVLVSIFVSHHATLF